MEPIRFVQEDVKRGSSANVGVNPTLGEASSVPEAQRRSGRNDAVKEWGM